MTALRRPTAPNITIDPDTASIPSLTMEEVPGRLRELGLSEVQRAESLQLAMALEAEARGRQDRGRFGEILERFRAVSDTVYQRVGKPLYLEFIRRQPR